MNKKRILLKVTGEILSDTKTGLLCDEHVRFVAQQIKILSETHYFGIVIGGGNFFRGSKHGTKLGITPSVGDQIGMLATMMNGLIIKDLFEQEGLPSSLFCAVPAPEVGAPISQQTIKTALDKGNCLIFSGGTGNPFFTTDTTAILRGLQIEAREVWKGTHIDGIYNADPKKNAQAQLLKHVTYQDALKQELRIMDATAFALAKEHHLKIRVFDIFKENSIVYAATHEDFGSTVE